MASCLGEGMLWIQNSCRFGEEWALPGYSCLRHSTWVEPLQSKQVMEPVREKFLIQWNVDRRKHHHTKNSEYKTGFKEISVLFNEKIFKIRKWKSKVPADSDPPRIHFVASRERFVVLLSCGFNEQIPSSAYNIYTLYDCFWGLERIRPFIG